MKGVFQIISFVLILYKKSSQVGKGGAFKASPRTKVAVSVKKVENNGGLLSDNFLYDASFKRYGIPGDLDLIPRFKKILFGIFE